MEQQKRKVRGYKITDTGYEKAMKRASKENTPLATMIEEILICYGAGVTNYVFFSNSKKQIKSKK
jgi:hypothetical protein